MWKKLWEKIKKWAIETALPWLKAGWMQLVNIIVLIIAYAGFDETTEAGYSFVVGFWLFLLASYYIFWKLFGAEKAFKKK